MINIFKFIKKLFVLLYYLPGFIQKPAVHFHLPNKQDDQTITMDTEGNIHRPDGTIEILEYKPGDPKKWKGYVFDVPGRPRKPKESLTFRRHGQ